MSQPPLINQRISLNEADFQKLVRGEMIQQGDQRIALQDIDHQQMFNAVADAISNVSLVKNEYWLKLDEGERQIAVLALAELALSRPGWDESLTAIAQRIDNAGTPMYEAMKAANADRVRAERAPVDRGPFITLRQDDEDIRRWVSGVNQGEPEPASDFLLTAAAAACRANEQQYPALRPAIIALRAQYPQYRFSGAL